MSSAELVLASASPRRRELLLAAGLKFEVCPSDFDEALVSEPDPDVLARELARSKAQTVARELEGQPRWLLAADTVVALCAPSTPVGEDAAGASRILGKPADESEARGMLRALSGSHHRVITGLCAIDCATGDCALDSECTWVSMRAIEPSEVEDYVASGEWRDKAGGYAIQESADRFVNALEGGGFDNVVGLPVERALGLLARVGWARRPL